MSHTEEEVNVPFLSECCFSSFPSVSSLISSIDPSSFPTLLWLFTLPALSQLSLSLYLFVFSALCLLSWYLLPLLHPSLFIFAQIFCHLFLLLLLLPAALLPPVIPLLFNLSHLSHPRLPRRLSPPHRSPPLWPRRWGRRWHRGRTVAVLFRLRHALPHRLLEGPVRLRSSHGLPERLGLFRRLHHHHRPTHGRHRGPGVSLRLHHRPQGLGHCRGVCGTRHIRPRWGQVIVSTVMFATWEPVLWGSAYQCLFTAVDGLYASLIVRE